MNIRRKWLAAILALVMMLSMATTVSADESKDADACIQQMLNYYRYHGEAAATDIDCLLYELAEIDPEKAQIWSSIMDYWRYSNTEMPIYNGVLPDGLPQDDSLCIVVMGYALANDGSMKKELVGRLETALASAQKYPNAYIICTGGGTAKNDDTVTEAGEMKRWLVKKGIDQNRIIAEKHALSTVGNALNTYQILSDSYPNVTHLAIITSDYHLPRSCMLFYAQTLLASGENEPILCIAANAAYKTGRAGSESLESQADNLSQLSKIPISGMKKPSLSKPAQLSVSGSTQCVAGTELNLTVVAHYDTGLYRDVTNHVKYSGFDLAAAGVQDVTISYEERGKTVSATVQIELLAPETLPPTAPPVTEAPTEAATEPAPTEAPVVESTIVEDPDRLLILPVAVLILLLIIEVIIIKRLIRIRKRRKAARAAAKAEKIVLPDDDSPLEYV